MKTQKQSIEDYVLAHRDERPSESARALGVHPGSIRKVRRRLKLPAFKPGPGDAVARPRDITDRDIAEERERDLERERDERKDRRAIRHLLDENKRLAKELDTVRSARASREHLSLSGSALGDDDATAVVLASDWHIEEPVRSKDINGLNEFNLAIAEERVARFWQSTARLIKAKQKSVRVRELVLCLLGDFFSGYIHDELVATNELGPSGAVVKAYGWIRDGLKDLLAKKLVEKVVVVCHSGNHARMSKKCWVAGEELMSLESIIYNLLAREFESHPGVEFVIPSGYHGYVDVHGFTLRTHHGHAIRYAGGVGGIYIPALKAINQWNKGRKADLDVFGHLHQFRYGGSFVCNGSLIGYGPFSVWIKGDYEAPSQTFFLVMHRRKVVTDICPIFLTE